MPGARPTKVVNTPGTSFVLPAFVDGSRTVNRMPSVVTHEREPPLFRLVDLA
jgi:hypothetical protein